MATGDILSVTIPDKTSAGTDSDGWFADIKIEGFVSGGTYDYGYTGNNDPSSAKVVFTVVSEGYNTSGTLGTVTRTIYGTRTLRKAYPNNASLDETDGTAGNLTVRVALSEPIYDDDKNGGAGTSGTDPTVTIAANWYTDDGAGGTSSGNNAATNLTVTNNSTLDYPKVVANWSRPQFEVVTGDFDLAVVAFHGHGTNGAPVQAVKFTVADQSTNSTTTTVSSCTVDTTYGDATPVQEYVGTIDVTGLDANEKLDIDFIAYPRVGDANSVLDTTAGTAAPSPEAGTRHMVNDKSGTYGQSVALVDDVSGNDGTGTVYDAGSYDESTANAYATINAAVAALKVYNNANYSRNDVSNSIVYLTDGGHTWVGAGTDNNHAHDGWLTITRGLNSTSRAAVTIDAQGTRADCTAKVKVLDVTINTSGTFTFSAIEHLWLDQCTLSGTGTAFVYGHMHCFVTRCSVTTNNTGLFRPFSTQQTLSILVRGNTFSGTSGSGNIMPYTFIGNSMTSGVIEMIDNYSGQTIEYTQAPIVAFNNLLGNSGSVAMLLKGTANNANSDGGAVVGNLIERTTKNVSALIGIAADGSTTSAVNNMIIWNNVFVGQRENIGYNDAGTVAAQRLNWSIFGNLMQDFNIKSDTFPTESGNRTGNWPVVFQVGSKGNVLADSGNGFDAEWDGIHSEQTSWTSPGPNAVFGFESFAAYDGTGSDGTAGAGGGDYRTEYAGAQATMSRGPLPYDLTGRARPTGGTEYFGALLPVPDPPTSVAQS